MDTTHDRIEKAIHYVLGHMAPADRPEFERLMASNPNCREDVRAFTEIAGRFLSDLPPIEPSPSLKDRLMRAVESESAKRPPAQHWKQWLAPTSPGRLVVRGRDDGWEATDIDGIRVRRLAVDEPAGRVTMMIRMDAGTRYPRHRHGGAEECYVVEGDLRHGAQVMRAGDFEWCPLGSVHDEQWTEGGCLLLVSSSCADELIS